MRTVLVRHTQKGLSVNITIITALCRHDLDRIQCLDVIKRHARIQVDDLIAIQGELGCRIPVESLHVRALEDGAVQRDFQTFILDITGVHLAGTIPGKRVERQVQQLTGRIRLIPGEIQTQAVLQETHVETGFP